MLSSQSGDVSKIREAVQKSSRPTSRASSVISLKSAPESKSVVHTPEKKVEQFQLSPARADDNSDEEPDEFALFHDESILQDLKDVLEASQVPILFESSPSVSLSVGRECFISPSEQFFEFRFRY